MVSQACTVLVAGASLHCHSVSQAGADSIDIEPLDRGLWIQWADLKGLVLVQ